MSVHGDDVHEGAVFGVKARFEVDAGVAGNLVNFILVVNANNALNFTFFMAFKSEKDNALTKSLISLWVVSARAVAERQANTTAHKRIAIRMIDADVLFQLMTCNKIALIGAGFANACHGSPRFAVLPLPPS